MRAEQKLLALALFVAVGMSVVIRRRRSLPPGRFWRRGKALKFAGANWTTRSSPFAPTSPRADRPLPRPAGKAPRRNCSIA